MKRNPSYYFVLYFISLFFLFSCKEEKKPVSSGATQTYKTIYSKSCSGGSLTVKTKTKSNLSATGQVVLTESNKLGVGDEVEISGKINKNTCGNSPLTFSCKGTVYIDTNRTFICTSGTLGLGTTSSSAGTSTLTSSSLTTNPVINISKFLKGEFYTYQNGTELFARVIVHNGIYACPTGFRCQ